ncbi:hypothetical protein GQ53DRAFT_835039 [Thozetella sp. PMI_491]|nr:hypothetical protein GQ53DRAFT_835039 [Thozetella sp. PMI_491]
MELQFIDNNPARFDPHSRKLIRSHVMKGRNLGKMVPKRGWRKRAARLQPPDATSSSDEAIPAASDCTKDTQGPLTQTRYPDGSLPRYRFAGSEFDYFVWPEQVTPPIRYLVYEFNASVLESIYPRQFCHRSPTTDHPWFQSMMTQKSFFHLLLVMTATFLEVYGGEKRLIMMLNMSSHFSKAVQLLNKEISSSPVPKQSTIAAVVSLTIRANLTGIVEESKIHLNGLIRMVSMTPGGITGMRASNPTLLQKVCRTDIEVALREGTATRLGLTATMTKAVDEASSFLRSGLCQSSALARSLAQASPSVRHIAHDVLSLCHRGNQQGEKFKIFEFQDIIISIFQRLLDFAPLQGPPPPNPADEAFQLGLLAFMTTIIHERLSQRSLYSSILARRLSMHLNDASSLKSKDYGKQFRLWLFFMYNFLVLEIWDGRWLVPQIQALTADLGLKTWKEAKAILKDFPWVERMHEASGKKLWEFAMPSPEAGESVKYLAFGI